MRSRRTFSEPEDFQIFADAPLNIGQFVRDLLLLHAGQALQLQFDDGLGLLFGKLASAVPPRPRPSDRRALKLNCVDAAISDSRASLGDFGGPDQPDHFVDIVERQRGSRAGYARARALCAVRNRCGGAPHRRDAR